MQRVVNLSWMCKQQQQITYCISQEYHNNIILINKYKSIMSFSRMQRIRQIQSTIDEEVSLLHQEQESQRIQSENQTFRNHQVRPSWGNITRGLAPMIVWPRQTIQMITFEDQELSSESYFIAMSRPILNASGRDQAVRNPISISSESSNEDSSESDQLSSSNLEILSSQNQISEESMFSEDYSEIRDIPASSTVKNKHQILKLCEQIQQICQQQTKIINTGKQHQEVWAKLAENYQLHGVKIKISLMEGQQKVIQKQKISGRTFHNLNKQIPLIKRNTRSKTRKTNLQKIEIMKMAREISVEEAATSYKITVSTVKKWLKMLDPKTGKEPVDLSY